MRFGGLIFARAFFLGGGVLIIIILQFYGSISDVKGKGNASTITCF